MSKVTDFIAQFEGNVAHFYLDSLGYVTVGVGHKVEGQDGAELLTMVDRLSYEPASVTEKRNEYAWVLRADPDHVASYYLQCTNLNMPDNAIADLLQQDVNHMVSGLSRGVSNFTHIPGDVQVALTDMAFQFGVAGLLTKWPRLLAAVQDGDFAIAALECQSTHVSPHRNQARHDLFLSGITGK